jgi:hypothetical protein
LLVDLLVVEKGSEIKQREQRLIYHHPHLWEMCPIERE